MSFSLHAPNDTIKSEAPTPLSVWWGVRVVRGVLVIWGVVRGVRVDHNVGGMGVVGGVRVDKGARVSQAP